MKGIIKQNKKIVIIASILNVLSSLLSVLTALMLSTLLNLIITGNIPGLINQSILMIIVWIITITIDYQAKSSTAKAIEKMNFTLRLQITNKLIEMNYEQFHSEETGSYVSWLTNDVTQIENTAFSQLFVFISRISMIVFSLCGLVFIHYWVAIVAIILCIIMFITPRLMNNRIVKDSSDMSSQQEVFVKIAKETMLGHEVFYSYNLLSRFSSSILEHTKLLEASKYKFKKTQALSSSLVSLTSIISQIGMIFVTGYLSVKGLTTVGTILPAGNLAGSFFGAFSTMLNSAITIKSSKPILEKFKFIPSETKALENCPPFTSSIELRNVSFRFNSDEVLKNISLIFEKGKKYAIIGSSGSGKTTLIKLILGHLKNYQGHIFIDDIDIKKYSQQSIMDNIAYISQNVYVFNETIKDNITLNENFTEEELNITLKESCLKDFVLSLEENINMVVSEDGKNISGGQKQRIALARALIRNKSFIVIDEGTSALDKKSAFEIESNLLKNPNITLAFITHHLNEELIDSFDKIIEL